ncbi:MAG: AzlC family ABC transporter permease [Lachnospiraceae bacterium]|nr:AzlC family ABC transporter permease [Lachnospiraceae bacterium]
MNSREFREGLKDGIPICLGYLAVSFAFGIQALKAGIGVFDATLISLTNVTSAGQFAGLGVIASSGSYGEMAMVQSIINLRYALMSAAVSQKLTGVSIPKRLLMAHGMTDEIFGISIARKQLSPFYTYGAMLISIFGWVFGTFLGASAGQILPERLINALGVALYGMFIAIVVPVAKQNRKILISSLLACALSAVCAVTPVLKDISGGLRIILVTVLVAGGAAALFPFSAETEG